MQSRVLISESCIKIFSRNRHDYQIHFELHTAKEDKTKTQLLKKAIFINLTWVKSISSQRWKFSSATRDRSTGMRTQGKSIFGDSPQPKPRVVIDWLIDWSVVVSWLVESINGLILIQQCTTNIACIGGIVYSFKLNCNLKTK